MTKKQDVSVLILLVLSLFSQADCSSPSGHMEVIFSNELKQNIDIKTYRYINNVRCEEGIQFLRQPLKFSIRSHRLKGELLENITLQGKGDTVFARIMHIDRDLYKGHEVDTRIVGKITLNDREKYIKCPILDLRREGATITFKPGRFLGYYSLTCGVRYH